jgi:Rrf2 family protein
MSERLHSTDNMTYLSCYSAGTLAASPGTGGPILSQTAEYALRAVVHLARHGTEGPVQANDLAEATDVPENYLRKVLHELVRSGVLRSTRGKRGGFQLAVPPAQLTLLAIVGRFDGITDRRRCLLGRKECSDAHPCPMHDRWKSTSEQIARFFGSTTVADVAGDRPTPPRGKRHGRT